MNFMIGCSGGEVYKVGQVIYDNPSNNETTFAVCRWDNSLAGKTLEFYSKKYNTTYRIKLLRGGEGSYITTSYPGNDQLDQSVNTRVVSDYLMCDNSWAITYWDANDFEEGPLQITKITIVGE